jgi:anti-sigma B factor antagonist
MAQSRIVVTRNGSLALIKVIGEGTFQNARQFKSSCLELLDDNMSDFVLDLGECTLLDSTFIGILLGWGLRLKESGKKQVHIFNANKELLELIKNLGLHRLFFVFEWGTNNDPSTSSG